MPGAGALPLLWYTTGAAGAEGAAEAAALLAAVGPPVVQHQHLL